MTTQIGHVEPFQPEVDDWDQYTERLEQYFIANNITTDEKKLAVFLTLVGSKTYSLLSGLIAPDKPSTKSYADLKAILRRHLKPKPLVIAERFKFHRRNQQENEGVTAYMAELRKLADKCEFGTYLSDALRDRLVCGLRSEATQRRLLTEENLTLDKAYSVAHGMEAAKLRASELQASSVTEPVLDQSSVQYTSTRNRRRPPVQTQATATSTRSTSSSSCGRCGKTGHSPDTCFYRSQQCRACGKTGHIARMCRTTRATLQRANVVQEEDQPPEDDLEFPTGPREQEEMPLFNVSVVKPATSQAGFTVELIVDQKPLVMEIDTGASVSLVSEETWKKTFLDVPLEHSEVRLSTYSGEGIGVLGKKMVQVKYGSQKCSLPLIVVEGNGSSLLGRNWLKVIKVDWESVKKMSSTPLDNLLAQYQKVFQEGLGTLKDIQANLTIKPGAKPKFFRARSVPYALKGVIEQELQRLEKQGIIEPVKYSDWAAPVVPVPKADGHIRLCGDYKVTINPELEVDQFPVPTPEDLFATLAGGKVFTKLDLSRAYQQVVLEPSSRKYVTVNTHKGLYQYTRLPFGVASAPAIFQQIMEKLLLGIPGVVVYLDDILITGPTDEEHVRNLAQVLGRLDQHGLRVKRSKCQFLQPQVDYLGYRIDKEGLHTMHTKVAAIVEAPTPKNVHELRAFLGLINYYGKFIPQLSTVAHPLNRLLGKNVLWKWDKSCQQAFGMLKAKMASTEVLAHYDQQLPLRLDCDASAYGVGAVLAHTYPDGSERPIAYASRTLSSAEKQYAQIEKEGLALIYGVKKFHKYLYGRRFTLVTDHKPLLAILGSKKNLPSLAAARLQRWAIYLLGYQYDLEFRPTGQHTNADGFSRLPLSDTTAEEEEMATGATVFNVQQLGTLPVTTKQLRDQVGRDPILSKVLLYTQSGWPSVVPADLKPFYQRRLELAVEAGCLLWGTRVVIPAKYQPEVLRELHVSHPGIVRMKGLARIHVWWPGMNPDIEKMVQACEACQAVRNRPPPVVLHAWPWPSGPWERIHVDYAGPFMGTMFFVVVDAYSKWLEVLPMTSTTAERTLDALRTLFARYGLPKKLVSDNGPQFIASSFEEFMRTNGIEHLKSAPYHPATNGEAERFVQTFKNSLKAGCKDKGTLVQKLSQFLLSYRITPHTTTGVAPTELFLKRQVRTRLDLLKPSPREHVAQKQAEQKKYHDAHARKCSFEIGQGVLALNLRDGPKWLLGTIIEKTGPVSYKVAVNGQIWRRHIDQLLSYHGPVREEVGPELGPELESSSLFHGATMEPRAEVETPTPSSTPTTEPPPRDLEMGDNRNTTVDASEQTTTGLRSYPQRERNPPIRFEPTFK